MGGSRADHADMTGAELVTGGKDLFVAGAAAVTATVAVLGLKRWQLELRGKASFETARALAKATYALRDAIHGCRSPIIWAGEFPDGGQSVEGVRSSPSDQDFVHVYATRWKPVSEAKLSFDAQMLEAEALWGEPIRRAAEAMRACLGSLSSATAAVIDNVRAGGEHFRSDPSFALKMQSIVHGTPNDPSNNFAIDLDRVVRMIEDQLRAHLRAR